MIFQGQPLTPFSQTAQTSRSGFESLLGVIRDEIAIKRQADALKKQVEVEKEIIRFRGDEQIRLNEATREQTIDDQLELYTRQKGVDLNYQQELFRTVTGPQAKAELEAEAKQKFNERLLTEKRLFFDNFRKDYGSIYNIASAPIPLEYTLDPNTYEPSVIIPDGYDEDGKPKVKQVSTQELFAEAEQWKTVSSFLDDIESNFNDLSVDSTFETAQGQELSSYTLVGRNEGAEIIREVRSGSDLGNQYVNRILSGELKLNVKQVDAQEEDRQRIVNSDYGAFLTQYSIFAANDGVYRVDVDRKRWFGNPKGWFDANFSFNFKTDSVSTIQTKYNQLINETKITEEQLSNENPDLYKFMQSFQTMLGHYYRSNPEAAQNPDNLFLNFDYNSNDPYSLFTRNPNANSATKPTTNASLEETLWRGSAAITDSILNN